jgi:hypothetical protein
MKVEQSQQQQHKDQTAHDEIHRAIDRLAQFEAVRNQMKSGNAQHKPRDKAHDQLGLRMRKLNTAR